MTTGEPQGLNFGPPWELPVHEITMTANDDDHLCSEDGCPDIAQYHCIRCGRLACHDHVLEMEEESCNPKEEKKPLRAEYPRKWMRPHEEDNMQEDE